MHYLTRSFLPRVYRIKIEGNITSNMTQSIAKGLQAWPYYPTALLVTINSGGGSITQAKLISHLLKLYSNRFNIPVVTFAEDACLGSANIILTSGVKSYSSPYSMIGDIGQVWSQLWADRLAKQYQIKQDVIAVGQNDVKLNPIEALTNESQTWVQGYVSSLGSHLNSAILANRGAALEKRGLSKTDIDTQVLQIGITNPQNLVKCGYLDGFKSCDQQIRKVGKNQGSGFHNGKYAKSFTNSVTVSESDLQLCIKNKPLLTQINQRILVEGFWLISGKTSKSCWSNTGQYVTLTSMLLKAKCSQGLAFDRRIGYLTCMRVPCTESQSLTERRSWQYGGYRYCIAFLCLFWKCEYCFM